MPFQVVGRALTVEFDGRLGEISKIYSAIQNLTTQKHYAF